MGRVGFPDLTGYRLGPYLFTDVIGSGANGCVYRAVCSSSRKPKTFAVKCLPKTNISSRRKFQLAGEIVNHYTMTGSSHILPLRDIYEEDLFYFIVLDLCETDMSTTIWDSGVYLGDNALIKKAFIEIVDGITACHRKGVSHRDLKPQNIMCNADGTGIRIGDFGLATNRQVCLDGGCGTRRYMSPECMMCRRGTPYYGSLTDIWALGIILFVMVTGQDCPWKVPLLSDKEFKAFIDDEDYLLNISPVSEELNTLLKCILYPVPTERLPLPLIRQVVLKMDTFYKPYCPPPDAFRLSWEAAFVPDPHQTYVDPEFAENPYEKKRKAPLSTFFKRIRQCAKTWL